MRRIAFFICMCAGCNHVQHSLNPPVRRILVETSMKVTTDGIHATGCAGVGASYSVTW